MSDYFDYTHLVTEDEIDAQGHVHNLRYLQWTLWAAGAHTRLHGWDAEKVRREGFGWVVREHDVVYRAAAMRDDYITVRTWVSDLQRFASRRKYVICRSSDRTILARVETRWVYVDLQQRKVVPIPAHATEHLSVLQQPPPLPWENEGE